MSDGRPLYPEANGNGWEDAQTSSGQDGAARYGTDHWQGLGADEAAGSVSETAGSSRTTTPYGNEPGAMPPRPAQGGAAGTRATPEVPSWRQSADEGREQAVGTPYGAAPAPQGPRAGGPTYGTPVPQSPSGAQPYGEPAWREQAAARPTGSATGQAEVRPASAAEAGTWQRQQADVASAVSQSAASQRQPHGAAAVPPAGVSTTQAQPRRGAVPPTGTARYEQPQRPPQAAPAAPQQQAKEAKPRRGGGVRTAVLGAVFGALAAVGVVFALRQFGWIGNTTVVTETAGGQTLAINTNGEDATVAKAVATKVLPSVVSVHVTTADGSGGMGSGVILDTDGNIITNNHVAGDASTISVTINGNSYEATLVGTDASSDLAVIKADLQGDKVTPVEVGDSDALAVGDWVATVGSPFGLDQSVSAGIVSSLSRNELMTSSSGNTLYANLIQTDASINPGNSGGALVNDKGQLVGISTLFSSDTESFAGIGFAIPGNYAIDVANKIISGETVTHAYIGLSMQTVNAQNAVRNNLPVNQGAYVAEVAEGGPAAEAGIEKGDIIIAMGGEDITSADGMILAVRAHKIGETVKVTVMRGSEELEFDVTLGSDESLQQQQQLLLDEQEPQVDGMNGTNGNGGGNSQQDILEQLYEYLYNNRGGSYTLDDVE